MKTVLIYSGGMDSTVLLYDLLAQMEEVKALGIDYGQRHHKELLWAEKICYGRVVPFEVADLSSLRGLLAGSSQTSDDIDVPEGHFEDPIMKQTVVPNRNMIMLSVAIGHAVSLGYDCVAYAAHQGDYAIYPDCRPVFVDSMRVAARLCSFNEIRIESPYQSLTKAGIAALGAKLSVPFELTWTCYKGEIKHCGTCGACVERKAAFKDAGVVDPTDYGQ